MQPGVYTITNDEYHAGKGISRSAIMEFRKSPKHYWHKYINTNYKKEKSKPSMEFGTMAHMFLLEPHDFDNHFAVQQNKLPLLKDVGREAYDLAKQNQSDFIEKSKGKDIITKDEYEKLVAMKNEIFSDELTRELVEGGQYEKSIYWIDPDTELLCKVRPDIWHENFIVDYKVTLNASPYSFQRDIYKYGYHLQFAMMHEASKYALNKEINDFIFLPQEKTEPYLTAVYQCEQAMLEYGVKEFKNILWQIKYCIDSNYFPGYKTQLISLPTWSKKN